MYCLDGAVCPFLGLLKHENSFGLKKNQEDLEW